MVLKPLRKWKILHYARQRNTNTSWFFFLCEELQKHWPCVLLDASSKVSKETTDLSKIKQVSSSTPISSLQVFLYRTTLIMGTHHTPHPREDLLSVESLELSLSYLFSDTEKSCRLKLQPFPRDVLSPAMSWSQAFFSFQQCLGTKPPAYMQEQFLSIWYKMSHWKSAFAEHASLQAIAKWKRSGHSVSVLCRPNSEAHLHDQ